MNGTFLTLVDELEQVQKQNLRSHEVRDYLDGVRSILFAMESVRIATDDLVRCVNGECTRIIN